MKKNNYIPLHVQLKEEIEQRIVSGKFSGRIPSERELMETYDVSRSTVREAINALVKEGILVKKHGKGTFVSIKPLDRWLGRLNSTTEMIHQLGMNPSSKMLEYKKITPNDHIKALLRENEVYYIKRLRLADNEPIGIEEHYYPPFIGERLGNFDLDEITLYDVIQNDLGVTFVEANQMINCVKITEEDRNLLGVDESIGILKAERTIKGIDNQVIEYEEAFYRSDKYHFEINLSRKFG